ncbi:hypothetical protein D1007_41556 [Hordeum vulgare]|uniref:F-box associated domain-containing protein n=1 Tax=Hordeum vulgare subsp. vulgare TaxID=112509 RepID=A0A8I6Y6H0_HORVV|nr:hypothetical protein D1007_41556 [Hordeum vulgare]
MAAKEAAAEAATPLLPGLLDDIVLWDILVRLDPKSLLRCRAVRRDWRCATSTRRFLLAHHARQPALTVFSAASCNSSTSHHDITAFDHRAAAAAQLHTVARLDKPFSLEASCDGLLVLTMFDYTDDSSTFSVCNPATHQHAPLPQLLDFRILGMYPHGPTGEYRLLLKRGYQTGFYVFVLGSDQPPRYIGCPGTKLALSGIPVRVRDSLHWYPVYCPTESEYETESRLIIVFDPIAESFREMRAPVISTTSYIFDMDDMLGIYGCNKATGIVDIWVLQYYESEVWDLKYRVELPIAEIKEKHEDPYGQGYWYVIVALDDGDVILLVNFGHWMFYVDTDGELVATFDEVFAYRHQLKQTLVLHDFFTALESYVVDASPFI